MKSHHLMLCAALLSLSTAALAAPPDTEAVELYNSSSHQFFVTASASEAAALEGASSWLRTGRSFQVWSNAASAPPAAQAVCRFYLPSTGAQLLTADVADCNELKSLAARAPGAASDHAWQYQGIAFYALAPKAASCAAGTTALLDMRAGTSQRLVDDVALADAMVDDGWGAQDVALCAVSKSTGTNANLAAAPGAGGIAATWTGDAQWESEVNEVETRVTAALSLTVAADGTVTGSGNGCTFTGQVMMGDGFRSFFSSVLTAAGCTDPAFNGDYRRVRLERFGAASLMVRVRKGDEAAEQSISALLTNGSATPPAPIGTVGTLAGDWTGTVGWKAEGKGQPEVDVNQVLSLSISAAGGVTGSGFGCTFIGTVSTNSVSSNRAGRAGASAQVTATGCTNPVFNGAFDDVRFTILPGSARLQVRLSRESSGSEVKIEGTLDSGTATTPPPPPPPVTPTAPIAGTWTGTASWEGRARDSSQSASAMEMLTLTIGSDGTVTGTGFGCAFTGQVTLSANGREAGGGQLTAAGCTQAIFNGTYTSPQLERDDRALEVELEREANGTKVKISGKLAAG